MRKVFLVLKYCPFYLLSLFPFFILNGISSCLYFIIYYGVGYRRAIVKANLNAAFPTKTTSEIRSLEKKFYHHFCDTFVHSMKVLTIGKKEAKRRITFENIELINDAFKRNENLILYGAHFGNWEWFAFFPLHIQHQFVSFYQAQSNKYFNGLSIHMRERFGNVCVESKTAYKKLLDINRQGKKTLAYVIGDQSPMKNSAMLWTDFFNQQTAFLVGAGRIASKTKQAVIYPAVNREKRGYYHITFKEVGNKDDSQSAIVERYAMLLEQNIQEHPELWLWTHRRWKMSAPKNS